MIKYTKLSTYKIWRIFYYFFEDFTATQTAKIMGINRNSVNLWYNRFREAIVRISIEESKSFKERYEFWWEFELDESYFGARRVRWKRGRWAAGKTPVFGLLKRDGRVFVSIVENCSRSELMPIILQCIKPPPLVGETPRFYRSNMYKKKGYDSISQAESPQKKGAYYHNLFSFFTYGSCFLWL